MRVLWFASVIFSGARARTRLLSMPYLSCGSGSSTVFHASSPSRAQNFDDYFPDVDSIVDKEIQRCVAKAPPGFEAANIGLVIDRVCYACQKGTTNYVGTACTCNDGSSCTTWKISS
jgi:hypothetical protein